MPDDLGRPSKKIFYGWYVTLISFVIMTVAYALYFSWPVFYVAILDDFGWSRADTSLIFSLASFVYGLSSPLSGFLMDRFGPLRLFIAAAFFLLAGMIGAGQSNSILSFYVYYSFLVALGTSFAGFIPQAVLVSNWFVKRRSTALGITQAGSRDAFLLIPLIELVIFAVGWRNAYLALGIAAIVIIAPLSLLLRARPQDKGLYPDGLPPETGRPEDQPSTASVKMSASTTTGMPEWDLRTAARDYRFWCLSGIMTGMGLCYTPLLNHFVAMLRDIGFTAIFAASVMTIYAVSSISGRLCGFLSDSLGREQVFTLAMLVTLLPLPILLLMKDTSAPWLLYIFMGSLGFGHGISVPVYIAAGSDIFQGRRFGTIMGTANFAYGVAAAVGTWLYGYIHDITGSYDYGILVTASAAILMVISIWIAAPRKVRRQRAAG